MDKKESIRPLLRILWFEVRTNKECLDYNYRRIKALRDEISDLVFDVKCADLEDTSDKEILIREKKETLKKLVKEVRQMEVEQTENKKRIKQLNKKL